MKSYDKVIFVCTANTFCSPIAEAVYKEIAPAWLPKAVSRGIVVLFSEPISPKVNVILSSHDMEVSNHEHSIQLSKEDGGTAGDETSVLGGTCCPYLSIACIDFAGSGCCRQLVDTDGLV